MNIALAEDFPLLALLLSQAVRRHPLREKLFWEEAHLDRRYDLLLSDRPPRKELPSARIALFPSFSLPTTSSCIRLQGGMNRDAEVTLSSIGKDSAWLCLAREIPLSPVPILPFEKKIPFDRNFSLYKNLAVGFALCLADYDFGEEV